MLDRKCVKMSPYRASLIVGALAVVSMGTALRAENTVGDLIRRINQSGVSSKTVMSRQASDIPDAVLYENKKREHVDLQSVRPIKSKEYLDAKKFGADRVQLEKITDRQIDKLYILTKNEKSTVSRGELWLRLAELYVEKADYIRFRKQSDYEKKLANFTAGKSAQKPSIDLSEADEYNKKAIQLYEYYVRDFRGSPKVDLALYFLGFNNMALGNFKKGAAFYSRLSEEFPRSAYINEANFSLGDYYFENDQWRLSLDAYKKVIKSKDEKMMNVALYKAAWCLYRNGQYEDGLKYLETLVRINKSGSQKSGMSLQEEAKRDLVVFYVEGGDHTKAREYFEQYVGEKDALKQVEKLAFYCSDKGYREKAAYLFKELIKVDPMNPKAYEYQYQIVSNYINLASDPRFKEELYHLVNQYGPNSKWAKENASNKEVVKNAFDSSEKFLRTYTLQKHQAAQTAKGKFSQAAAAEGYKLYLSVFKDTPTYPDMMFYYGEILYDMNQFGEAAKQYVWVAQKAPQSKFGSKAAMNMILGLEKNLPTEEQMQAKIGNSTEPLPLDPRVKEFINNSEWYLSNFPKAEKNVELQFKVGRLYYLSNQFADAERVFKGVIQRNPKSKQAEYASNLLLDMYNLKKDYAGLERVGSELLANKNIDGSASASQIKNVLERAAFKAGEDLEQKKEYLASAKRYSEFTKKYPQSPFAMKAQFNAGVNFQRANKVAQAVAAFEVVQRSKDKDALVLQDKIKKIVPKMYQDMGMFQKAADAYVAAASQTKSQVEVQSFIYNAAVLYDALNLVDLASKYYSQYSSKANSSEKAEVAFKSGELNYRNKRWTKAIESFQDYIRLGRDPELSIESHFKVSVAYSRLRQKDEADQWKQKVVAVQRRFVPKLRGPGARYAAQVRLELLETQYSKLAGLRFSSNTEAMKRVLTEKLDLVGLINRELSEIIKYDSPDEVIGALEFLGRTNEHMYASYMSAPIPGKIAGNEEAKKKYLKIVEEQALPFRNTAIESYRKAVSRGSEFEAYPKAYFLAYEILKRIDSSFQSDFGQAAGSKAYFDWMELK